MFGLTSYFCCCSCFLNCSFQIRSCHCVHAGDIPNQPLTIGPWCCTDTIWTFAVIAEKSDWFHVAPWWVDDNAFCIVWLRILYRAGRPLHFEQARPCIPFSFTNDPHMHLCSLYTLRPCRNAMHVRKSWSFNAVPMLFEGIAWSHVPDSCSCNALNRALSESVSKFNSLTKRLMFICLKLKKNSIFSVEV